MTRFKLTPHRQKCARTAGWLQETAEAMNKLAADIDARDFFGFIPPNEEVYATEAVWLCQEMYRLLEVWSAERNPAPDAAPAKVLV